jgi:hypothetical protein
MSQPREWIRGTVPISVWTEARAIREVRDRLYGNRFPVADGDMRELGEVAEICFRRWLERKHVPHKWIKELAAGNPDFYLGWLSVDVKARKRSLDPKPEYTMQVGAAHMDAADWFFFCGYTKPENRMLFLGAITKEDMLKKGRRYEAGEKVHPNYTVPGTEAIYNVPIAELEPPQAWLAAIMDEL